MLNRTNRALLVTGLVLAALLLMRLGQQATVDPPGFALPAFEPGDVALLSVCAPARCAAFELRDGRWGWKDGSNTTPVDQARIAELMTAWQGGRRTRYKVAAEVTGSPAPEFGTMSQSTVEVRFERSPDDEIVSLEIGESAPDGGRYVMREGDRAIYVLDVPREDLLRTDVAAWTDREALRASTRSLDAFGLLNSAGRLEFERAGDSWLVTEPSELTADPRAVGRLLDEIGLLAALPEVGVNASIAARAQGLDRPRLSVWTRRGDTTTTWHFAGDAPDGRGVFVDREGGEETLQMAEPPMLARLDVSPDQIKDLVVLHFELTEGRSLRWSRDDREVTLNAGDGDVPEVALALSLLSPLRALPGEAVVTGEPVARLVLTDPDGEREISVYSEAEGTAAIAIDGRGVLVSSRLIERFDGLLD